MKSPLDLSRRERELMEIVYALGEGTTSQIRERMADPPSRTAVRTFLRILEEKGYLKHREEGREFVYRAVAARGRVGKSVFRRVLETFFEGSLEKALAAHFSDPKTELSAEEVQRLQALIAEAKKTT